MNRDSASNMQTINAIILLTNMCGPIVTVVAFVIIPRRYLVAYRTLRTWDRKVTLFDRNSNCLPGCLRHKTCGVFFFSLLDRFWRPASGLTLVTSRQQSLARSPVTRLDRVTNGVEDHGGTVHFWVFSPGRAPRMGMRRVDGAGFSIPLSRHTGSPRMSICRWPRRNVTRTCPPT